MDRPLGVKKTQSHNKSQEDSIKDVEVFESDSFSTKYVKVNRTTNSRTTYRVHSDDNRIWTLNQMR